MWDLVPWPGIEPGPLHWEHRVLITRPLGSLCVFFKDTSHIALGHSLPQYDLSSVQFSCSVVSNSLWPHGLQHARPPCPSPAPGADSNSCSLNQWCHPTISSSVVPFSFHLQSFPASRSFQMSQFFAPGGQRIGVSASASVLLMTIQDWFPLGSTGLISLLSKGLSKVFFSTTISKHQVFSTQTSLWSNSQIHTRLLEKPLPWLDDLCWQSNVSTF